MGSVCAKQKAGLQFKTPINVYHSPRLSMTPSPEYIYERSPLESKFLTKDKILPRKCQNCNYQHYKQSPSGFCSGECKQSFYFSENTKKTALKRNLSIG